jgi:toxin ParE1/3/4
VTDYVLSRLATFDLDEIWDYSAKRWGREQANKYVEGLRQSMLRLAVDPSRGRSVTVRGRGYLRYKSGSHTIFYRATGRGIYVVRVLHQSMNHERHLR